MTLLELIIASVSVALIAAAMTSLLQLTAVDAKLSQQRLAGGQLSNALARLQGDLQRATTILERSPGRLTMICRKPDVAGSPEHITYMWHASGAGRNLTRQCSESSAEILYSGLSDVNLKWVDVTEPIELAGLYSVTGTSVPVLSQAISTDSWHHEKNMDFAEIVQANPIPRRLLLPQRVQVCLSHVIETGTFELSVGPYLGLEPPTQQTPLLKSREYLMSSFLSDAFNDIPTNSSSWTLASQPILVRTRTSGGSFWARQTKVGHVWYEDKKACWPRSHGCISRFTCDIAEVGSLRNLTRTRAESITVELKEGGITSRSSIRLSNRPPLVSIYQRWTPGVSPLNEDADADGTADWMPVASEHFQMTDDGTWQLSDEPLLNTTTAVHPGNVCCRLRMQCVDVNTSGTPDAKLNITLPLADNRQATCCWSMMRTGSQQQVGILSGLQLGGVGELTVADLPTGLCDLEFTCDAAATSINLKINGVDYGGLPLATAASDASRPICIIDPGNSVLEVDDFSFEVWP